MLYRYQRTRRQLGVEAGSGGQGSGLGTVNMVSENKVTATTQHKVGNSPFREIVSPVCFRRREGRV
jgi:hypothetical protein